MSSDRDLEAPSPPTTRRRRTALLIAALLVAGAATITVMLALRTRSEPATPRRARHLPPDPRLHYEGPFGNISPDVSYVGDEACTRCHRDIAASYHRHPMGRSLQSITAVAGKEVYDRAHNNPFDALDTRFSIEVHDKEVRHRAVFAEVPNQPPIELSMPVHYVIGSGTHGRSYLTYRNGFLFQTPISWFSDKQFWNLSPGFTSSVLSGRAVDIDCLYCHSNRAAFHDGTINRFNMPIFQGESIGCERCHGPGGRHVETTQKFDIVNPRARVDGRFVLSPQLRDAVCEQCHLEGEERIERRGRGVYDYRPGLPVEEFWTVFVPVDENGEQRAVSHVEQMYQSRCYQGSSDTDRFGKLGCVTCHDPHVYIPPSEQPRYYRGKCLLCHSCSEPESSRLRRQPDDSCIACHMPRFDTSDIAHAASTDHRIPRRPGKHPVSTPPHALATPMLKPFYGDRPGGNTPELRRDLGIALTQAMARRGGGQPPRGQDPIALLEAALRVDPEDLRAWTSKGTALLASGKPNQALASFQSALQVNPEDEEALRGAARATEKMGQRDDALDYWHRLIAVNPEAPKYRGNYALLLEQKQSWDETRTQCREWIRRDPKNVMARSLMVRCLLQEGNKDEARREFARLMALKPGNAEELRAKYEKQLR